MGCNPPPENQPREIDRCDRDLAFVVALVALAWMIFFAVSIFGQWRALP